ncbi:transposase [Oligella urethralis]|uniref:transposase n=1 Tax=Oligella urethralis TaxID=90245 RepID=UPI000D011357|nr:transposase [Oligella urethralis]AVL71563.1 transposase [Oligella urethralis]
MNEIERSVYCREHGLYPEQLEAWQTAFEATDLDEAPVSREAQATDRRKIQQLERKLRRKEKALAETAALLTLSKKARAIWGDDEDN